MAKAKRQQKLAPARRPAPAPQPKSGAPTGATGATGAAGPSRIAAVRAASGVTGGARVAAPQQRRRYAQEPWWRRNLTMLLTVGGIVALIAAFIVFAQIQNNKASVGIGDPVSASVMKSVTSVPPSVFATVGSGTALNVFQATPKGTAPLTADGKPLLVYIGAEYCPYCAATRWSTVVALSRFGAFSGLTQMRSSGTDAQPNTATFSFRTATYTSLYISFSATEDADRSGSRLATPPPSANAALTTYDVPPYTSTVGGIPFMSYGNRYVTTSGLFVPSMLQGLDWNQIASQLNNPNSDVAKAIIGGANEQTAAICALTNNQPGDVCNAPEIQQIEAKLPQPK